MRLFAGQRRYLFDTFLLLKNVNSRISVLRTIMPYHALLNAPSALKKAFCHMYKDQDDIHPLNPCAFAFRFQYPRKKSKVFAVACERVWNKKAKTGTPVRVLH